MRFTIRDLLWLTVVVAVYLGWYVYHVHQMHYQKRRPMPPSTRAVHWPQEERPMFRFTIRTVLLRSIAAFRLGWWEGNVR